MEKVSRRRLSSLARREVCSAISSISAMVWGAEMFSLAREMYPRITCNRLLKSWAMPPARMPMASIFRERRLSASSFLCRVTSSPFLMNLATEPSGALSGEMLTLSQNSSPFFFRFSRLPCHSFPWRMVAHSSRYVSEEVSPDLRMRGVCPTASSAAKPVTSQNLRFTYSMVPVVSVMSAMLGLCSRALERSRMCSFCRRSCRCIFTTAMLRSMAS
ncbi:hypothetical protein FO488_14130 [Geobacter sp. FeAm09]|nr:hypothetical protein [Geobacter sp. FeAm09]QEM69186.1 hypothetical protein FO488_14130 [Geobacter sp. FeAm09]